MIRQSIRNLYRHELEELVKKRECKTPEDVIDMLFGTYDNDYRTDLVVKKTYIKRPAQTITQRLNTLWVYPAYIGLMPFRYILFGSAKVSEDSKFGKILIWLIGELR